MLGHLAQFTSACAVAGLLSSATLAAPPPAEREGHQASSKFTALASTLPERRLEHTQTRLQDGRVLIAGGIGSTTFPAPALRTAVLFDPSTEAFTALAGKLRAGRTNHTATLLPGGQVLLAGGQTDSDSDGVDTAELFDPATQKFTAIAATMTSPRGGHAAALLPNGKVLLAGGFNNSSAALRTAELFDPATGTFTAIAALMVAPRDEFTATSLPSGQVLLAGGSSSHIVLDTAELFDPGTGLFTAIPSTMASARHAHAAAPLPTGQVLLTGGSSADLPTSNIVKVSEIFDPATQTFSTIKAKMTTPRFGHAAALLNNGYVLLTGGVKLQGDGSLVILKTAEKYGP
jgi:N-acetylneuraminic acid mutarotase